MQEGMLWFDNDRKASLAAKVKRAAEYYRNKYGQTPNACHIHLSKKEKAIGRIKLTPSRTVQPNHFWIGVDDA
jgi:hypothetical protein